jgi:hypothetical protein
MTNHALHVQVKLTLCTQFAITVLTFLVSILERLGSNLAQEHVLRVLWIHQSFITNGGWVPRYSLTGLNSRVYPKVSELAGLSENCKGYDSATRCSCIAILWVSLVSFAAITLCVASQRVFIVIVYFVIVSVRKLLDIPSHRVLHFRINHTLFYTKQCKSKIVPVFKEVPRHEDVLEECRYNSMHS